MIRLQKDIVDGQCIPSWWYGLAYRDWEREAEVWHPLPLNFIVRWAHRLYWRWNRWRGKQTKFDLVFANKLTQEYWRGFSRGRQEGMTFRAHCFDKHRGNE